MKRTNHRFSVVLLLFLLITVLLPVTAFANAAEPPGFTVIVSNPPADLSISLQYGANAPQSVPLSPERKGWEGYYRFHYHTLPQVRSHLNEAVLLVEGDGTSFTLPLPQQENWRYNTLLTLDFSGRTLTLGQPPWRTPVLVAGRVLLTLLLEGALFWCFGYRTRRSWGVFLSVNLLTQLALNAAITGPLMNGYWVFGFLFGEVLIFLTEMILFACLLREFRRRRAVLFAFLANTLSLLAGGLVISYLPI